MRHSADRLDLKGVFETPLKVQAARALMRTHSPGVALALCSHLIGGKLAIKGPGHYLLVTFSGKKWLTFCNGDWGWTT